MKIHLWGTDFRRSSPQLRAKLFLSPESRADRLRAMLGHGFSDLVYVYTCNRVEFYTTAEDSFRDTRNSWMDLLEGIGLSREDFYRGYHVEGKSALRHLLRVACSLESMVVGEPQILGQLKEALRFTKESGLPLEGSLERCFQFAFETAKRVRTETALGEGAVSVATLGLKHLQALESKNPIERVVLVGRSPIVLLVLNWLGKNRPSVPVTWVNRDPQKLISYAESQRTSLMSLNDFLSRPPAFSHLFTATSSEMPLFSSEFFSKTESPVVFDFAQPPDVEPNSHCHLVRLENLNEQARQNAEARAESVLKAEAILEDCLREFLIVNKSTPIIKDFNQIEPKCLDELTAALAALEAELPPELVPKLRKWADKLVKRNLHHSREHLKTLLKQVSEPRDELFHVIGSL